MTVPPHDLETERHLIGACYYRPAGIPEAIATGLTLNDFYSPNCADDWNELVGAHLSGQRIRLDAEGLWMEPPQVSNPAEYASRIVDLARRRRLLIALRNLQLAITADLEDLKPDLERLRAELEQAA